MPADESRLDLEHLKVGDQGALQALVVRHLPGLESYLRLRMGKLLRARESCSDLVQSVCREVLAEAGDFEYRGEAAFRHWLYTRAQRKLLHRARDLQAQCRDPRREQPLDEARLEAGSLRILGSHGALATPSRVMAAKEAVERIERAFDALPEDHRDALAMRRLMGLGYDAIAVHMGRSEGAVRNLVHRAVARFTLLLECDGGTDS